MTTDLGTVGYAAAKRTRGTAPIGIFAVGRGVSIREIGAVRGGGVKYDVEGLELAAGMVQLARDAQYFLLQGNATNSGGLSTNEGGPYNSAGIDGWRGVTGGYGSWAGNGAIQIDMGSMNLFQSIKSCGGQIANLGGHPTAAYMGFNAKEALDIEMGTLQTLDSNKVDVVPGIRTAGIPFVNGMLTPVPMPGTTLGTYLRSSDNNIVEDIYVIDESRVTIPWLFAEGWTVLEIPTAVDSQLSHRWIVFGLYGIAQKVQTWEGKVRRIAA